MTTHARTGARRGGPGGGAPDRTPSGEQVWGGMEAPQGPEGRRWGGGGARGAWGQDWSWREAGAVSGFVISSQAIPFSNKHEENQYKLSNEVQYILSLTKHNSKGTQRCPPVQNTGEKWRLAGGAKLRVWSRWCPRVHVWEGKALVALLVLP